METYKDKTNEFVLSIINAFDGKIVGGSMKIEGQGSSGDSQFIKFKDLKPGTKFTITGEATIEEMKKKVTAEDGTITYEPLKDQYNPGQTAMMGKIPIKIDGEDKILNAYPSKLRFFAEQAGTVESKEWITLNCKVELVKNKKGAYHPQIVLDAV